MFGPDMIPKGVLSEEQEDVLNEIIGEEQSQLVEDIAEFFVNWPLVRLGVLVPFVFELRIGDHESRSM